MTYQEAIKKIDSLQRFGSQPGLERIRILLERMGNPQKNLQFVHVAGTNGKGSTCVCLSGILQAAGYKTGLFISPYVTSFTERMQINGKEIPREELSRLVEEYFPLVQQLEKEQCIITEFEFVTAIGFAWFVRNHCQVVVLEVGLGGRFDATNVIDSALVSVITSISLDHTAVLGDSIEKIAFEKSGILKPGGTCVCYGDQPRAAVQMIRITAEVMKNRMVMARPMDLMFVEASLQGTRLLWKNRLSILLPLLGEHQMQNAATVLSVVEELRRQKWQIPDSAIQAGFASASFPARMEVFSETPPVLLDGAHNPGGTAALAKAVKRYLPGKKCIGIMGMLRDKDVDTALRPLEAVLSKIYTVAPPSPRAMPAEELAQRWSRFRMSAQAEPSCGEALEKALQEAREKGTALLVCGSLYLAGEIRPLLLEKFPKKQTP